ncbi:MAG: thioredoxin family protein [Saprospiraceae bacterium]|nr:thioredoxin family protein [Saprospiraceae bacterium]
MKSTIFTLFLLFAFKQVTPAQGIDFFHGTFEEALEEAKKQDKAIFVDAFTTWCGPCKRMSKYVFTDKSVGEFYNENFINMKLDMEKEQGMKFGLKYPVSAYPTFYFIKSDGEVLFTTKGGRQAKQFIELGEKALSRYDDLETLKEKYEEGERDPKFIMRFITALKRNDESALKVANDYLDEQADMTTLENLAIIDAATVEADSRIYDLFIEHGDRIMKLTSKEEYLEKGRRACLATVDKAIEFNYEELLEEAQSQYEKLPTDDDKVFEWESNMIYFAAREEAGDYMKNAKRYLKKHVGNDANQINEVVEFMIRKFKDNKDVMEFASPYAEKAAEFGGLAEYHLNHAYTLYYQEEYQEAKVAAEKALELAIEQKSAPNAIRALINKIDQR